MLEKCSTTDAHPGLANSPFLSDYNITNSSVVFYNKIGLPLSPLAPSLPLTLQFQILESREWSALSRLGSALLRL